MTLHKLSVADGYTYLTRHVAGGDRDQQPGQDPSEYYTAEGNPPGRWGGRGSDRLNLSGQVREAQMRHLFGQGMHPDADRIMQEYIDERTRPGTSPGQVDALGRRAIRHATLGRRFPEYKTLEDFEARVTMRLEVICREAGREPTEAEIGKARAEEARRARGGVAGYDLVFTPVKSLVLLWALDERPWVQDAVRSIHEQARDSALALLEEHAAFTRTGDVGQAQLATNGLVYARFDHYDSRDGDPNLHTHVAISNKIQGTDGKWRSLDGRALHRIAVAASEHYNTTVEQLTTAILGVQFATRPDTAGKRHPVREILGIPAEVLSLFSARRRAIEARYEQLVVDFRRTHGRDPDNQAAFRLAEQANLDTRGPKPLPRSLAALRDEWRQRLADAHGPRALRHVTGVITAPEPAERRPAASTGEISNEQIDLLAALVVGRVELARSTWTVWNLRAETERLLREPPPGVLPDGIQVADPTARTALTDGIVERAVAACVPVTVHPDLDEPTGLRRPDGVSVFIEHGADRYTSQALLDAEARLVGAARTPVTVSVPTSLVASLLEEFEATTGTRLDAGQRAMVTAFATDPHLVTVGLGPAGAGKTTTMRAYQHVLAVNGQRLIPLAASSAAAAVLAEDLGVPAENVHKFVHEHRTAAETGRPVHDGFFQIRSGDVIVVDEAGLAGTGNLDTLRDLASRHGAVLRLLGDHRQLSAVESGGALRLLATEVGAVELTTLHRFTNPDEAQATRRLRDGDPTALDFYTTADRILGGSTEAMIERAYSAWQHDMRAGLRSLMVASTSAGVTALAARARADRVAAGHVERHGVTLHDGNLAGRGDWIITRDNRRTMTCNRGRDWVRNGDAWQITHRHRDGSLKVRHLGHGGTLTLPANYVTAHVELLYATTVHRAQGATVDTTHALITDDMTRETLYVAATRARQHTTLYAITHQILPVDEDSRLDRSIYDRHARAAREILETVLATEGAQPSATEAVAQAKDDAKSLATLVPRLRHAAEEADNLRLRNLVADVLQDDAPGVHADAAWSAVVRALRTAETAGWDLPQVLAATARRGPLAPVRAPAELLAWRINDHTDGRRPALPLAQPTPGDTNRYAALLAPIVPDSSVLDPAEGTRMPRLLHTDPVTDRADPQHLLELVLGRAGATRALHEAAWPSLTVAIRRAEHAGHRPLTVVATTALTRPLDDARSLSQTLAWRIGQYLDATPPPTPAAGNGSAQVEAWRTLAWTLKGAETTGHDLAQLLETARPGSDCDGLRHHLHQTLRPTPPTGILPWLDPTPQTDQPDWARYLHDVTALIRQRIDELTTRTLTQQPAWLAGLGQPPNDPQQHADWRRNVGIVAAYRDQYQVTLDDPTQPLGGYIATDQAAHRAYLHAANAVLAARHPEQPAGDPATWRVAVDTYLALPDHEREMIVEAVAARLGRDWLGPRHGDADSLLTAPAYAAHLHRELLHEGILRSDPQPARPATQTAPPPVAGIPSQVRTQPPLERPSPQIGIEIGW